jgi:hypothetical protein
MIKKIIILFLAILILPNIFALQMLEPVMIEVNNGSTIEVGVLAPGEYFLVSFYMDTSNKYDQITTDTYGESLISFDNIQTTKESIFAVAKINENATGEKNIKVILKNTQTQETTEIYLKALIESNVIATFVLPYNKRSEFEEVKEVTVKLINKSITTKKVTLSSNLPNTWFEGKENISKEKTVFLQPAATIDVTYQFIPKVIGETQFEIYIYTQFDESQTRFITPAFLQPEIFERNVENVDLYIVKNLNAVYGSNLYNFPTFGLNSIPVYFFNNLIRIITN